MTSLSIRILIIFLIILSLSCTSLALEDPQITKSSMYIYDTVMEMKNKKSEVETYNLIDICQITPDHNNYTIQNTLQLGDINQIKYEKIDIAKLSPTKIVLSKNLEPVSFSDNTLTATWDNSNKILVLNEIKNFNIVNTKKLNLDNNLYLQQLSNYLVMGLTPSNSISNIRGIAITGEGKDFNAQPVIVNISQSKILEKIQTKEGVVDCYKIHLEADAGGVVNWLLYISGIGSPFIGDYWVSNNLPHILIKSEEKLYGTVKTTMILYKTL